MSLQIHQLRRDRIRLRKILSAQEVASYYSWAEKTFFTKGKPQETDEQKARRLLENMVGRLVRDRFKNRALAQAKVQG